MRREGKRGGIGEPGGERCEGSKGVIVHLLVSVAEGLNPRHYAISL